MPLSSSTEIETAGPIFARLDAEIAALDGDEREHLADLLHADPDLVEIVATYTGPNRVDDSPSGCYGRLYDHENPESYCKSHCWCGPFKPQLNQGEVQGNNACPALTRFQKKFTIPVHPTETEKRLALAAVLPKAFRDAQEARKMSMTEQATSAPPPPQVYTPPMPPAPPAPYTPPAAQQQYPPLSMYPAPGAPPPQYNYPPPGQYNYQYAPAAPPQYGYGQPHPMQPTSGVPTGLPVIGRDGVPPITAPHVEQRTMPPPSAQVPSAPVAPPPPSAMPSIAPPVVGPNGQKGFPFEPTATGQARATSSVAQAIAAIHEIENFGDLNILISEAHQRIAELFQTNTASDAPAPVVTTSTGNGRGKKTGRKPGRKSSKSDDDEGNGAVATTPATQAPAAPTQASSNLGGPARAFMDQWTNGTLGGHGVEGTKGLIQELDNTALRQILSRCSIPHTAWSEATLRKVGTRMLLKKIFGG